MVENLQRWQELYNRFREYTMVWEPVFWDNLELCHQYHQSGHAVVECGVWKGGMIAAIAEALNDAEASYHLFDSFEGLPQAKPIDGPAALKWQADCDSPAYYDNCRASLEDARSAMELAGARQVQFHPGWFETTLPGFKPANPISILRLDADWYDSTLQCLTHLYPHVAEGGLIILDDYFTWDGCARAVHDYISKESLPVRIRQTVREVAYIVKQSKGAQFPG